MSRRLGRGFFARPTLDVAAAWLADQGVMDGDLADLYTVADALGKRTVHFLGLFRSY